MLGIIRLGTRDQRKRSPPLGWVVLGMMLGLTWDSACHTFGSTSEKTKPSQVSCESPREKELLQCWEKPQSLDCIISKETPRRG